MKKIKADGEELFLPENKSEILSDIQDCSILLYGEKKIGKTSLAAEFPDAFMLFFEPGGKFVSTYNAYPKNWKQFKGYLKLLEAEKDRFRTVVIDTVDLCYKFCYDHICAKMGIEHPQDEDYGSGWQRISNEFMEQMNFLLSLNRGVIFISHSEEREIKVRSTSNPLTRVVPTMPKQARRVLEAVVDIWAYYRYRHDEHELVIKGNEVISAGHRLQNNFIGIRKISMGNSPKQGYNNFVEAFNTTKTKSVKIKLGGK